MMNLNKKESESEADMNNIPTSMLIEFKKSCSECNTRSTPLWRGGPAGTKSVCNACGIKYNKRRRALLGLDKARTGKSKKKKKKKCGNSNNMLRIVALGREMVLKKRSEKQRMKLGEEEQAAILLMALSSSLVDVSMLRAKD